MPDVLTVGEQVISWDRKKQSRHRLYGGKVFADVPKYGLANNTPTVGRLSRRGVSAFL